MLPVVVDSPEYYRTWKRKTLIEFNEIRRSSGTQFTEEEFFAAERFAMLGYVQYREQLWWDNHDELVPMPSCPPRTEHVTAIEAPHKEKTSISPELLRGTSRYLQIVPNP